MKFHATLRILDDAATLAGRDRRDATPSGGGRTQAPRILGGTTALTLLGIDPKDVDL